MAATTRTRALPGLRCRDRHGATACVAGEVELVRSLGSAGIRPVVVAPPESPARWSRYAAAGIDPGGRPIEDVLADHGAELAEPAVLYFDTDDVLLAVSRNRDRLAESFAFRIPDRELTDDLIDKGRFQALAERIGLPVPAGQLFDPAVTEPRDVDVRFPLILKAVPYRTEVWRALGAGAKALQIDERRQLEELWPRLLEAGTDFLAQELLPGGEDRIVSYHAYVDGAGSILGEFTGRKIRTNPPHFGMSSALVTTDDPDLVRLGRELVDRIGVTGPAKLDFKLDPAGAARLLEVNARFTLWVQPGAVAGVNLAAIAYAELTGAPCPPARHPRPGVRWIDPRGDLASARATGIPLWRWVSFAVRCETNPAWAWNDPGPLLRRVADRARSRIR